MAEQDVASIRARLVNAEVLVHLPKWHLDAVSGCETQLQDCCMCCSRQ